MNKLKFNYDDLLEDNIFRKKFRKSRHENKWRDKQKKRDKTDKFDEDEDDAYCEE